MGAAIYNMHPTPGQRGKEKNMSSIAKVIEVIAESEKSWDDAVKNCLSEVSETVQNIREIWVSSMKAVVENNRIVSYRITANVTFLVRGHD
jgi:flavin-binding protein dodecin